MKNFRLNRIFDDQSGCFLGVALDEQFFAERDILSGLDAVRAILRDGADVLQVSEAQAPIVQVTPGAVRRPLILNLDSFLEGKKEVASAFSRQDPLEPALRLDAACVAIKLNPLSRVSSAILPESRSILRFKDSCDRYGMPVMFEIPSFSDGTLKVAERNLLLMRHAIDLGADVIRTNIPLGLDGYYKIVEVADGVPVIAAGNEVAPAATIVKWAGNAMRNGVRGILLHSVMIECTHATSLMRSLRDIVHRRIDAGGTSAGSKVIPANKAGFGKEKLSRRKEISNLRQG